MLKSIEANFDNPEVYEFLIKHFIELKSVSPEGSTHVLDIGGLKDPSIKFWSLWENNSLLGSGAIKFLDKKHGEFKSIRVNDKFRRKGYGLAVINHLIEKSKKQGIKRLSLETGAGAALHDFGGTDGLKGDLGRINHIPFDGIEAKTNVWGTGYILPPHLYFE